MKDKVQAFVNETFDTLEELENSLIALEKDISNDDLLDEIFRKVHTIKGTCGFLELERLGTIYHNVESILERIRSGQGRNSHNVGLALDGIMYTKNILFQLEQDRQEPEGDDSRINDHLQNDFCEELKDNNTDSQSNTEEIEEINSITVEAESDVVDVKKDSDDDNFSPEKDVEQNRIASFEEESSGGSEEKRSVDNRIQEGEGYKTKGNTLNKKTLKVDVDVLERIMNMVGELVLTRNEFLEHAQGEFDSKYFSAIQKLDFVTSNLQNETMKTRMQPVQFIWDKLPSIIRDGCKKRNKRISLEMKGQNTEIDRQVLQAIHDPFIHIIRNAIDHGIESPKERLKKQKTAEGTIFLRAYHEGGHIIIEVEDDGAGIDTDLVRRKAIERSLISAQESETLSEKEILKFIFKPGFSTADELSDISGRGMGMNIVKSDIDKIGGSVEIFTKKDEGTTFQIKIPLTLAILSALIFKSGEQLFAIPQTSVVELVRVDEHNKKYLGHVLNTKMFQLRDRSLPLINLREVLGMENKYYFESPDEFFIIFIQVGQVNFGIIVDDVQNTQEIVVKPLGRIIEKIQVYSGATILGDGMVILIVDPTRILEKIEFSDLSRSLSNTESAEDQDKNSDNYGKEMTSFLLFRGGDRDPMAVPLSLVSRLEEVPRTEIEVSKDQYILQYRDSVLPLIPVDEKIDINEEIQSIIVFSDGKRSMGLLVSEIEDAVEGQLELTEIGDNKKGTLGYCILGDDTRGVIDLNHFLQRAYPDWFEIEKEELKQNRDADILIVDDSPFFRDLLKPSLEAKGFHVSSAENGQEALKVLQKGYMPKLVISDLIMPEMDGFNLASEIRNNSDWCDVKLIALTSLTDQKDRDRAMSSGFDTYLLKFNQEEVLNTVKSFVEEQEEL